MAMKSLIICFFLVCGVQASKFDTDADEIDADEIAAIEKESRELEASYLDEKDSEFTEKILQKGYGVKEEEDEDEDEDETDPNGDPLRKFPNHLGVPLTRANWDELVADRILFVRFCAPWHKECKAMDKAWKNLQKAWHSHKKKNRYGVILDVDCTDDKGELLCEDYHVEEFPHLMYGQNHDLMAYHGDHDQKSLFEASEIHIRENECTLGQPWSCSQDERDVVEKLSTYTLAELDAYINETEHRSTALMQGLEDKIQGMHKEQMSQKDVHHQKIEKNEEEEARTLLKSILLMKLHQEKMR
eukprot:TRINITY_DN8830_c0_g1_i1.p1 TRINITY_DN8830_c0_g1~~TRINITY_DN8830_c0_g1_i1.p1  ORF type:complete len:319 (+),score=61.84 TRINITY_DN8830_c0_g1_i1:56-958(+)